MKLPQFPLPSFVGVAAAALSLLSAGCAHHAAQQQGPPLEGKWLTGATYITTRPVWLVIEPKTHIYYLLPPGAQGGEPNPHEAPGLTDTQSTETVARINTGTRVRFTGVKFVQTVDYQTIQEWGVVLGGEAPGTAVMLDALSDFYGGDYPYRSKPDEKYLVAEDSEAQE